MVMVTAKTLYLSTGTYESTHTKVSSVHQVSPW